MFGLFKKKEKKVVELTVVEEIVPAVEETVDLASLSDEELYQKVFFAIDQRMAMYDDVLEGIATLNTAEKNIFICGWYESQIMENGILFFLTEDSHVIAPLVADALGAIGAPNHKVLYTKFLYTNDLDAQKIANGYQIPAEKIEKMEEDSALIGYMDNFYEFPMVQNYMARYIRAHLDDLQ